MLNFISMVGFANGTINFTDDLSILLSGLIGLVWLSAGMIVFSAVRGTFARPVKSKPRMTKNAEEYRLAA